MGYFVFLILVFLLSACTPAPTGALAAQTMPPTPSSTAIALPAVSGTPAVDLTATQDWTQFQVTLDALKTRVASVKSLTPTPTLTLYPLPTEIPRPNKQVLIEYGLVGGLPTRFEDVITGSNIPSLILYSDGQIILHKKKLLEKNLSIIEICSLLKKIEDLGFYQIPDKPDSINAKNPVYDLPPGFQGGNDGPDYHILVNGPDPKEVFVNYLYYKNGYAVPVIEKLIPFLANFQPSGMQEYHPDRLLLYIKPGREDWVKDQTPAQWPNADIHLSDYADVSNPVYDGFYLYGLYLTGDIVPNIYALFQSPYADRVVIDEGQEYTVDPRPLLPNESRKSISDNRGGRTYPSQFTLPFQCSK
jgi:hypothetical protein